MDLARSNLSIDILKLHNSVIRRDWSQSLPSPVPYFSNSQLYTADGSRNIKHSPIPLKCQKSWKADENKERKHRIEHWE